MQTSPIELAQVKSSRFFQEEIIDPLENELLDLRSMAETRFKVLGVIWNV